MSIFSIFTEFYNRYTIYKTQHFQVDTTKLFSNRQLGLNEIELASLN